MNLNHLEWIMTLIITDLENNVGDNSKQLVPPQKDVSTFSTGASCHVQTLFITETSDTV